MRFATAIDESERRATSFGTTHHCPYGSPSGANQGESVVTYWVRLRQEGHDGDWQPYRKTQANSPIEAAESVYGRPLATIGSHYQIRALVRPAGQTMAMALYDRFL